MTSRRPKPLKPWVKEVVLLGMPLSERMAYVRKNLPSQKNRPGQPYMSQADFARAVGTTNVKAPTLWESGTTPSKFAKAIAALTPYDPAAFGAAGEAELVRQSLGTRLLELEDEHRALRDEFDEFAKGATARLAELEAGRVQGAQQ